jgi:hypothetical protein
LAFCDFGYCEFVFDLITDLLDLRGVISVVAAVATAVSFKKGTARPPSQITSFHIAAVAEVGNPGHKLSSWDSFTGY